MATYIWLLAHFQHRLLLDRRSWRRSVFTGGRNDCGVRSANIGIVRRSQTLLRLKRVRNEQKDSCLMGRMETASPLLKFQYRRPLLHAGSVCRFHTLSKLSLSWLPWNVNKQLLASLRIHISILCCCVLQQCRLSCAIRIGDRYATHNVTPRSNLTAWLGFSLQSRPANSSIVHFLMSYSRLPIWRA